MARCSRSSPFIFSSTSSGTSCGVKTSGFDGALKLSRLTGTSNPSLVTVTTLTYSCTAPADVAVPPVHFVPLSELLEPSETFIHRAGREPIFHAHQSPPDIRLSQKREKVAALDLRFQEYRKAEP